MAYYKHTYTVVVLSESADVDDFECIADNCESGDDCLHTFERTAVEELTPKQAADALCDAGSQPEFFQLDDDGNKTD